MRQAACGSRRPPERSPATRRPCPPPVTRYRQRNTSRASSFRTMTGDDHHLFAVGRMPHSLHSATVSGAWPSKPCGVLKRLSTRLSTCDEPRIRGEEVRRSDDPELSEGFPAPQIGRTPTMLPGHNFRRYRTSAPGLAPRTTATHPENAAHRAVRIGHGGDGGAKPTLPRTSRNAESAPSTVISRPARRWSRRCIAPNRPGSARAPTSCGTARQRGLHCGPG